MSEQAKIERLLRTAKGQIDGIIKMMSDGRSCADITAQLNATQSILRKVNVIISTRYFSSFGENDEVRIKEITKVLNTLLK